ncbi:MAG: hypothetical protein ACXWLN_06995 [Thermoanaerobaculia bacterium]
MSETTTTPVDSRYFRLRPYVFLVKGAARSALYDLHRRRIFPIPPSAAWVIERCQDGTIEGMLHAIDATEDRAAAREYLQQLGDLDFGRCHDDVATLVPFRHSVPEHVWQRIRLLSIDLRGRDAATAPHWEDLLRVAHERHGTKSLTVFVSGDAVDESHEVPVVEAAVALRYHHVEVVFPGTAVAEAWEALAQRLKLRIALTGRPDHGNATYRRLQAARLNVRFSHVGKPATITQRLLVCDHDSFRRLRNKSVHANSLHINARGDVFPWALEEHHRIGNVADGASLRTLMAGAELRRVWSFNKDGVEKCRECEFRYACPNSYTFRENAEVVGSAPVNCDYDPRTGEWRTGATRGLFDAVPPEERVEQHGRFFDTVSHVRNPLPGAYVELLDAGVDRASELFGIPPPASPLRYLFYPSIEELQDELAMRDGVHVSGLTEYAAAGDPASTLIRTAFPGHVHEVLHALLLAVNPEPAFFTSEACATVLGTCWGTEEDLFDAPAALKLEGEVRVTTTDGQIVDVERSLLHDDKGLLIGPLRRERSVHAVARHLIHAQGAKPYLHSWLEASDERGLPGYFYELGGSFFLWLIETRGKDLFLAFYASKQTLRHLEGHYDTDIATLTQEWTTFLTETN